MNVNTLTAVMLAIAGFALGLRQILLQPGQYSWPCAPRSLRIAMFLGACVMGYMAMLFFGHADEPTPYAGPAGTAIAVLVGLLALYFTVMLLNVLSQRRPRKVWERIEKHNGAMHRATAKSARGPKPHAPVHLHAGRARH